MTRLKSQVAHRSRLAFAGGHTPDSKIEDIGPRTPRLDVLLPAQTSSEALTSPSLRLEAGNAAASLARSGASRLPPAGPELERPHSRRLSPPTRGGREGAFAYPGQSRYSATAGRQRPHQRRTTIHITRPPPLDGGPPVG